MRIAAIGAAPVAVIFALAWFSGLIYRVDYPGNPAVALSGVDEPPVDLAAVQRSWPSGVDGGMDHARLAGFMQRIDTVKVTAAAATPTKREPDLDIGTRLARADLEAGRLGTRVCASCHTFERGGPNRVGPNLWGVVGRQVGSEPGFSYSRAFATHGGVWSYEELDRYLTSPARAIPGNKMSFAGIRKQQDRANVIAYLGSLSATPMPYPAPKAAPVAPD